MTAGTGAYVSPFDDATLIAIGKLITAWAITEATLAMQVARAVSVSFDQKEKAWALDVPGFHKAALVTQGTHARASLMQLKNLMKGIAGQIKPHADAIINIKERRDSFAHHIGGAGPNYISLVSFGASRSKMGKESKYTAPQIENWCAELANHSKAIDILISDAIWFNWDRIQEAEKLWSQHQFGSV